jgi:hypothetical protein
MLRSDRTPAICRCRARALLLVALASAFGGATGCAALTNPAAEGVPARRVPAELLAPSKAGEQTVPLTLLRQPPPREYRLAAGDVLGVYVEGFLGERNVPLPVHVGPLVQGREQRRLPPALGYPVPVQPDGTVDLPVAGAVAVQGLSLAEARQAIRALYVRQRLLKAETANVLVTLLQPRQYAVLVLRQEGSGFTAGPDGLISGGKRGTGFEVDLAGYENDVLHAPARTGGLPGLDAYNEVVIYRDCFYDGTDRPLLLHQFGGVRADRDPLRAVGLGARVTRIPLRLPAGQAPCVRPEDVILGSGDVVFLEARDDQLFYTGGLLPPAAHVLPRDHDLDVLAAVALVRGPLYNGAFGGSNLSGDLVRPGIGNPSPSQLTVLRRTPGGGQVPILVDLDVAVRDPAERLLVRPGDVLILQEKPEQALARYFSQTFFNFNLVWEAFHSRFATGVIDVSAPDRLPGRLETIQTLR